jgi:hypothetical protein
VALGAGYTALSIYIADPAKIIRGYGNSVVAENGEIQFSPGISKDSLTCEANIRRVQR